MTLTDRSPLIRSGHWGTSSDAADRIFPSVTALGPPVARERRPLQDLMQGGRQVGFVDRRGQAAQRQESLGLSTESTRYCSSCGHLIETDSPRQMSTYLHSDHNLARANLEIR